MSALADLKASFDPVTDAGTRVLVLGSLPGEISLRRGQYYANPQNQFWRLLGGLLDEELTSLGYDARLGRLAARGVGLWDVVRSARRAGSLDGAIRDHQPNALREFAGGLPALSAIAFNGATAAVIGRKALGDAPGWALIDLPSSSPAHTVGFEQKMARWRTLAPFLEGSA